MKPLFLREHLPQEPRRSLIHNYVSVLRVFPLFSTL